MMFLMLPLNNTVLKIDISNQKLVSSWGLMREKARSEGLERWVFLFWLVLSKYENVRKVDKVGTFLNCLSLLSIFLKKKFMSMEIQNNRRQATAGNSGYLTNLY